MRNMAFKVIDRLFIVAYGSQNPTDDEWNAYLTDVERHGIDRTMQLIATDGGGPTAVQRRVLNDVLAGRAVPVAVVSSSPRIRYVVTALSWFNRRIKAFPPTSLRDAIAYLEIPASRAELIQREMTRLEEELERGRQATA